MDIISFVLSIWCFIIISIVVSMVRHDYMIRRKMKNVPAFKSYPLIGHALTLLRMTEQEQFEWHLSFLNHFKDGMCLVFLGSKPVVYLFKPEFLEIICPSTVNLEKGIVYELLKPWLGNGLLTSAGTRWFHDRKLIGPTFHFGILDQFAIVLSEKAEILTKCLEKEMEKCPGKAIDIFPFLINATLDIICETAMGVNIRAQEVVTEYSTTIHRLSKLTLERLFTPWYWMDWLYYSMPVGKEYKSALNILHGFTKEVINKKKVIRKTKNGKGDDTGKQRRKAFLDLLLDQNEKDNAPLTEDELRAQVDTFMFEGHDTTAVAINWALFCLGNNLEHQEKVHEELEQVFKDTQTPASVKELSQLKYLERVMKETLRLYPSVPIVERKLAENVKIGDVTIPEGTTVALSIIMAHRNPQVWPDPLKFDPDRFLPENSKHRNPYAYVPFSAGPRNCIGQRFALLVEKTVLTAILRKWRVKSVETEIPLVGSLILRPIGNVLLRFTPKTTR
ncbi:PREDICTED: cytochrome P450 4C1-like [Dinoponera quadriceps]|uniref:Cytochrome P450 4C1-like n=1 Tax=Dinoponera quadriceps TaxID=609295 RepID=A0A6P3Y2L0_DINQU|nr:PREDICTED: cytochrome P450 4C1-like [Dinoponera quadriceps]